MTERTRTNPLLANRSQSPSYGGTVIVNGHAVPTEIHAYATWLNSRERRVGTWRVVERDGERRVEWMQERGSTDWLKEQGFAPKMGRVA